MKDIQEQLSDVTLIADKGYLSADLQLDLFQKPKYKNLNTPPAQESKRLQTAALYLKKKQKANRNLVFSTLRAIQKQE